MRVARHLKAKMKSHGAAYFITLFKDGKSIIMGQLFQIELVEDRPGLNFHFSDLAAPYIFELQQNFYTLRIKELSMIKSKFYNDYVEVNRG